MLKKLTTLCAGLLMAAGLHAQGQDNNRLYGNPQQAGQGIYRTMQQGSKGISFSTDDIEFWCGTGSNEGTVIIAWDDSGTETAYVWGVRWNGSNTALGMMDSIAAHDSRLTFSYTSSLMGNVQYSDGTTTLSSSTNGWCYYLNGSWAMNAYGNQPVADGDVIEVSATCMFTMTTATAVADPNPSAPHGSTRVSVGNGTVGTNLTPFCTYYNHGTTELLYTASELNYWSGVVDTLWFEANSGGNMPYSHLKIYMGTTSATQLTSWESLDNLQLVYSNDYGYLTSTAGWEPFVLNTPYYYNGTDNLVVVTCRQGTIYSSNQTYRYTSTDGRALYLQSDDSSSFGTLAGAARNTPTTTLYRTNLRLSIDTLGTIPCPRPDSLAVDSLSPYYAHLNWQTDRPAGGWALTFSPAVGGTTDTVVSVAGIDLNGLVPSTEYTVTVRTICDAGDPSRAVSIDFVAPCLALTAADLPYVEDFNGYAMGSDEAISPCWNKGTNYSSYNYPYTYRSTNIDGSNCLYFYAYRPSSSYSTRVYSYAALPAYDGDLSGLMLQFDMRSYSGTSSNPDRYCSRMIVGVMSDPTDTSTFEPVDTVSIATLNTVMHAQVYFENYSGSGRYVALMDLPIDSADMPVRGTLPTYSWIYVDNVVLAPIPTCRPVSDLTVQALDHNSATLSWHENGNATSWVIGYGSTSLEGSTNPYTLTGLAGSTAYTIGVAPLCSAIDTGEVSTVSIITDCDPVPVPFVDDFEGYGAGSSAVMNTCYRKGTNYSTAYPYPANSHTTATSSRCLSFYGSASCYSYLAFPAMDTAISQLVLSFKALKTNEAYGVFYVGTMSNANDLSTFEPYDTVVVNGLDQWEDKDVVFANYSGTATHIAILTRASATGATQYAFVDDVMIDIVPTCFNVSDLHSVDSLATSSSLTLSWTDHSAAIGYQIGYKRHSYDPFTYVTATANPYTLGGLLPNTDYILSVTPVCAVGDTAWTRLCTGHTTCADTTPLPYAENFNGVAGATNSSSYYLPIGGRYALPACWTVAVLDPAGGTSGSNAPQVFVSTNSSYSYNGSQFLVMRGYSNTKPALAALPLMSDAVQNLQIDFDYRQNSASYGQLELGVMTDADDTTTFFPLQVLPRTTSYVHVQHDFTLDSTIPVGAQYIAFRHWQQNSYSSYCSYIDNVSVTVAPLCKPVHNLAVSISSDTADITWTSTVSGATFEVGYGLAGTDTDSLTLVGNISDTAAQLVLPNGLYDIYVRTNCGIASSPWVGPVSAATGLFVMDGTDTLNACGYVLVDHAGLDANYGNNRRDTVVFLPADGCTTYRISGHVSTENNYDYVYLFDTPDGAYSSRYCGEADINFTSSTGFLKVVFTSDGSSVRAGYMLGVTCQNLPVAMADSLQATVVGDSAATLSWAGSATTWLVSVDGQTDTVLGHSHTFTGLDPLALHTFGVASICGASDSSNWATLSLRLRYSVSATASDSTMGSVSGSGVYPLGEYVELTATAAPHYHFVMWDDSLTTNPRTVYVSGDRTLVAIFAADSYTVSATSADETMGIVSGGGIYPYGDTVTLTATPAEHHHFVMWNDGLTEPVRTLVVLGSASYVAHFALDSVTVSATSTNPDQGFVTGSGTYAYGATVTLTAISHPGYHFASWSDGLTDSVRTFVATADVQLSATFDANRPNGIDPSPADAISISLEGLDIVVNGAEGQTVTIFDQTGRILVSEIWSLGKRHRMPAAGVYLVRVGHHPAQKVVVVR